MTHSLAGFNGQQPDPKPESYHPREGYRLYSPALHLITASESLSPFGAGGINAYAHCSADTVNRADPVRPFQSGARDRTVLGLVAGIALSILTEGAAMPVVVSLIVSIIADAAIGAGAELDGESLDGVSLTGAKQVSPPV